MTDDDLSSLIDDLRAFGTDVANVEAKRARDALPRSVRETLSAFANTSGGVLILGLEQVVALAMLRDGDALDNARYRAATGLDSRVATADLQDLVARELVVQVGERRWAKYVLSQRAAAVDPDAPGPESRQRARADRRDDILAALDNGPRSRAELAEITGLSDKTVSRWLRVLRREGRVQVTTGSPQNQHTRYRRVPEPEQGTLFGC
jgi:ATP-dependent DNA helicase RecG